jgi:hypothetical protein
LVIEAAKQIGMAATVGARQTTALLDKRLLMSVF